MNVKNYPYGRVSKQLRLAVKWINKNKKKLKQLSSNEEVVFDYPYYLGMPNKIHKELESDEVDWIQSELYETFNKS